MLSSWSANDGIKQTEEMPPPQGEPPDDESQKVGAERAFNPEHYTYVMQKRRARFEDEHYNFDEQVSRHRYSTPNQKRASNALLRPTKEKEAKAVYASDSQLFIKRGLSNNGKKHTKHLPRHGAPQ